VLIDIILGILRIVGGWVSGCSDLAGRRNHRVDTRCIVGAVILVWISRLVKKA